MTVQTGEGADILPGNAMPIRFIPPGTQLHNLELQPGKGAQVVRAAAAPRSCSVRKAISRWSSCRRVKFESSVWIAWPRSARSVTSTTRTSRTAKQGEPGGMGGVRRCAAWR